MITDIHISETGPPADAITPTTYEVNMFNCYKHRRHFFNRCKNGIIHHDVLLSFWMMFGYLSPFESVDEACKKGTRLLRDMIQGGLLKPSDEDPEMIELAGSTCSHGFSPCDSTSVGFVEMMEVDRIEKVLLTDGMMKKRNSSPDSNYLCRQVFQSQRGLQYIAQFNPTLNSLNPLLETINNPSVLILRGFDHHPFPTRDFAFENFKTLTVLEISGSGNLNIVPLYPTISKLTQLRYLNLSDPLIDSLPEDLFSKLVELRWLILRGCSRLDFDENLVIEHLRNLEVLDLSYTSTTRIPLMDKGNPTHLFLRDSALTSEEIFVHDKTLKFADLSGNQILAFTIRSISELVVLDLSRTKIKRTDALYWCSLLRNLILRECTSLETLDEPHLYLGSTDLEVLDAFGCENLVMLPKDFSKLKNMKELNLAGCSILGHLREGVFDQMSCLVQLDLSATKLKRLPPFANLTRLRKLTLRGLELDSLEVETWTSLSNLVKLDLHGIKISTSEEFKLDFLRSLSNLQSLDLSKTPVAKLPDISMLVNLKELLLADCWSLKAIPDLRPLTSLETLDVSLSDDPIVKDCQLEVKPGARRGLPLSLRRLIFTNRPGVQRLFPLSSLGDLQVLNNLCGTNQNDFTGVPSSNKLKNHQAQRTISKVVEFHIVYDVQHTSFDRFIYEFESIGALISEIQRSSTSNTANTDNNEANNSERQFEMLRADMKYIHENIDRLKGSHDSKGSEELLWEILYAVTDLSTADFKDTSRNLKQLLRLLVRLKLLFPPTQMNVRGASKTTPKTKQPLFIKCEEIVSEPDEHHCQETILRLNYQALTRIQKNCLLCFSAFPCNEQVEESNGFRKKRLVIKEWILIYWWLSEGFLEEESFQDNGKQMLEDLREKGFIEPLLKEGRKSASLRMHCHVHSFVTAQAKNESFFDFGRGENKWLHPYFTRSKKDSLPKTQAKFPVCAKLWENNKNYPRELESMRNVVTLFNANGSMIDIKPEWFSKMEQLSTLSLGSWGCYEDAKQIEIVDQKFLEELKRMKQLRVISLQGLMPIMKLPDSISKLTNLLILDLRECGYLEELPTGIGSLKNLIHLDLTDCVVLNKMPKGIRLLSNLEVLRGFKITCQQVPNRKKTARMKHGKDKEVCTLRDLSSLKKLNKLSLVVNIKDFPSNGDLAVLKGMKCLRKLKILWERSLYSDNASGTELYFRNIWIDWELEKLELWCIPYKTLPYWLHPRFLSKLEKLYIVGGHLVKLEYNFYSGYEELKYLRLKYLQELRVGYSSDGMKKDFKIFFRQVFPNLRYMEIKECYFCSNSIWWNDGERIWDLQEDSYPGIFLGVRTEE